MKIYLDNAATTRMDDRVLSAMLPYMKDIYGNASSLHSFGREALNAVDSSRATVAELIGAHPNEIYFTSGATESDNWALKGAAKTLKKQGNHIITTEIEHPAVLAACAQLEKEGCAVTYLKVNGDGIVSVDDVKKAVRDETILISVMFANNEIGSVQPIEEIGAFAKAEGILFHTDAVQAMNSIRIDVKKMNIDMMSFSAHKFHGPKGIGVLYANSGVRLDKFIAGGHQERGYRAGTINTPGIVGTAAALSLAVREMDENNRRIKALRDHMISRISNEIPYCTLNGGTENRLVSNVNFSFDYIEGESILMLLDLKGIAVSSGSACASGSLDPSHVILAIGQPVERAHSSIRFSLGSSTTKQEIDYTVDVLKESVDKLRSWSPLFNAQKGEGVYV